MKSFTRILVPVLYTIMVLPAFAQEAEPVVDGNGPDRVVAIGGSLTEIVYALGAEKKLVAVDSTSRYPEAALKDNPDVGYMRTLSAEPILSMNPDLILAVADAGPPEVLEQLRSIGIKVLTVPDEPSIAGVFKKIRTVAGVLGLGQRGESLISEIKREYLNLSDFLGTIQTKPRVMFLLSVGRSAPLVAGLETAANSMITLAGGENVMTQFKGHKTVTPEAVVAADPELVVIPQRTFARYGSSEAVFALPELATTPAARNKNLVVFDGLYLVGFGPRTVQAIRDLALKFHPYLGGLTPLAATQ